MDITAILICLLIGIVAAFIVTGVMKAELKTVKSQSDAGSYVRYNSLELTQSRDIYLYRNVTRRAKPKNENG